MPKDLVSPPSRAAELEIDCAYLTNPLIYRSFGDEVWEGEERRRWIYLLRAPEALPKEWAFVCDCGAPTRCYWVALDHAELVTPQPPWLELARAWCEV